LAVGKPIERPTLSPCWTTPRIAKGRVRRWVAVAQSPALSASRIRGVVQHGDKVGRSIGFPTANLAMGGYLRPRYGIYAVTGTLPGGRVVHGAANLGVRPQFDPPKELLEPHFFDFAGDLYGQEIEVAFHHFLRGEEKFATLEELTAQIEKDCARAKSVLGDLPK